MTYRLLRFVCLFALLLAAVPAARAQFDLGGSPFDNPAGGKPQVTASAVLNQEQVVQGGEAAIAVLLDIPEGLHTQSHTPLTENLIALAVTLEPTDGLEAAPPFYPPAVIKNYPKLGGNISIYEGKATIYVPLKVLASATAGDRTIKGEVFYQACDDSVCFPPATLNFEIKTTVVAAGTPAIFTNQDAFTNFQTQAAAVPQGTGLWAGINNWFTGDGYAAWFITALFTGLLFNVFPCVLPVLPLKAMSFYNVAHENRLKSFALGTAFSVGIVATFGVLAMVVLVFNAANWGQLFGNPWFAGVVTVILIALALNMFGLWEIALPTGAYAFTPRQDTITGNVLFGIFTAILSTPCTFGLFATLLLWAATQPAWVGVTAIMTAGFGMAMPYLILSATPELARRFPRTGPWSNVVKQLMGFLLLAVALYFGRVLLPDALRGPLLWWAMAAIVAAGAVFLIFRTTQIAPRARPIAIAVVLALTATASASFVARELTKPTVGWVKYTPAALDESRQSGKPVVVKFTADWCLNCQAIEANVFGDQATQARLKEAGVVPVKVDLTRTSAPGWTLLRELTPVAAIPFTAVYLPGEEKPRVLTGLYSSDELAAALRLKTQ